MDGAAANGPGDDLPRHEYGNLYPRDLDTCTRSKTELYREAAARGGGGRQRYGSAFHEAGQPRP